MSVDVESRLEALGEVWNDTVRHVTIDEVIGVPRPATVVEVLPRSKARRTPMTRAKALVGAAAILLTGLIGALIWNGSSPDITADPPTRPSVVGATTTLSEASTDFSHQRVTANVIGSSPSNFEPRLEIDRGSSDGIRVGMPVVDASGLVGRVSDVRVASSIVIPLTAPQFQAAVITIDNRGSAPVEDVSPLDSGAFVVQGHGSGEPLMLTSPDRSHLERISVGDEVVTAGGALSLAPAGISIGRVIDVGSRGHVEILVEPRVDVRALSSVDVVLYQPSAETTQTVDGDTPTVRQVSDSTEELSGVTEERRPFDYLAVGDSVMLGAADELRGRGFTVDAVASRQMVDMVPVMEEMASAGLLGSPMVVHLGTHGAFTRETLEAFLAPLTDVANVVILNVHADRPWVAKNNALLAEFDRPDDNLVVLDWDSLVDECFGDCLAADGLHLAADGRTYYAALISRITGQGQRLPAPDKE